MERLIVFSFIIIWLTTSSGVALAQQQPPDLTVTLHDVAGAPLAGVTVIIRDAGASQTLAQAATDTNGLATFANLMESQIRIVIAGTLSNGTKLYQPGNDAAGIRLMLDPLPATLALRSAADGMIVPDPAAMARESRVPVATAGVAIPPAAIAPTVSVARAIAPPPAAAPAVAISTAADQSSRGHSWQIWLGVAALVLLIGTGVGIVVVQRRAQ